MIILGNSTILGGVAGTASAVVCTVYGTSTISFVETPKELSQGYLPVSVGTIYTTGSGEVQAIRSICLVNISSSPVTGVQLFVGGTGTVNTASPLMTLPAIGGSALYEGTGWTVYNSSGVAQQGYALNNNQVTNAYLAQAPASTIKGNSTSSTANVQDLTSYPQIPDSFTTTATAGGTTTLTSSSNIVQAFTGSSNQTIQMPSTTTLSNGASWVIANGSTGLISIQSSGSSVIATLPPNAVAFVTYSYGTGVTSASWSVTPINQQGFSSIATAGGTTTLTSASSPFQLFTGLLTQTILLPVASTMVTGMMFSIFNQSTGSLTLQTSDGYILGTVNSLTSTIITCILASVSGVSSWDIRQHVPTSSSGNTFGYGILITTITSSVWIPATYVGQTFYLPVIILTGAVLQIDAGAMFRINAIGS